MDLTRSSRMTAAAALTVATLLASAGTSLQPLPAAAASVSVVARQGSTGTTVKSDQGIVGAQGDGHSGLRPAAAVKKGVSLSGVDISWPQCPRGMGNPLPTEGKKMPTKSAKFVVVGLTNGPGFYPNPCLDIQMKWIKDHHVYAAPYSFTTYPTSGQLAKYGKKGPFKGTSTTIKLKNTGYAQAQFNVATMKKHGLSAPFVWVDVEASKSRPWSSSRSRNKAVLDGVIAGYKAAGMKVGFYSTPYMWNTIIGSARYNLPEWRTVGGASKAAASRMCSARSVQGGKIVMAQWWVDDSPTNNSTDYDVMCPGYSTPNQLRNYFRKY